MGLNEFTFLKPEYFLLIIFPILTYFLFTSKNSLTEKPQFYFPNLRFLKQAMDSKIIKINHNYYNKTSLFLLFLTWLLLTIAIARPVKINHIQKSENNGYDLMLVLDSSLSMNALDFSENVNDLKTRLSVVKEIMKDFIKKRQYDRIGMITFGDYPILESPLTTDNNSLINILEDINVAMAGNATAIGDALILATKTLINSPHNSRAIILLTDGDNTSGKFTPLAAANITKKHQIPLYTIGIGSNGRVPFLNLNGGLSYQFMAFNPDILKEIAQLTKGKFFYAENAQILAQIYQEIDQLIKYEFTAENISYHQDYYHYFLWCAMFSWLFFLILLYRK